jgi:hypothetical protein
MMEAGADGVGGFETTCGEDKTQYFGEVLVLPQTTGAGWYGSYGDTGPDVPSACHCLALCVQHIKEGCRSYKYYEHDGIKHCYLQSNLFSKGEGYWGENSEGKAGRLSAGQWDYWRSGTPGRRLLSFSPASVNAGETFTLEIEGVGLPYDPDENYNNAPRQRVKIMQEHQECKDKPPPEVTGIGCTETLRKVATAYGTREELVYTICSPRPLSADAESLSFGPITITASSEDVRYKVCYCASQCYEPSSYQEVPGRLSMTKSVFLWKATPETVYRKVPGSAGAELLLTVERPTFGSFSNPMGWELKVVRDYFGCNVLADNVKFKCGTAAAPVDSTDFIAPTVSWEQSYPSPNFENMSQSVPFGADDVVLLVFDEKVYKTCTDDMPGGFTIGPKVVLGDDGEPLPSIEPVTVSCGNVITEGTLAYINFGGVSLVSDDGSVLDKPKFYISWDAGALKDASGMEITNGTSAEYDFHLVPSAGSPEIKTSIPMNGGHGVFTGDNITLYLSMGRVSQVANLTMYDCGDDGLCGSKDDVLMDDLTTLAYGSVVQLGTSRTLLPGHKFSVVFPPGSILTQLGTAGPAEEYIYEFYAGCPLPTYLLTPDIGVYSYALDLDVSDTGNYVVCFREQGGEPFTPMPSEQAKFLKIQKIEADRTHPRGIFHNQYFSALAGSSAPLALTVAGTRVPVPTDGKIAISAAPKNLFGGGEVAKQCGGAGFYGVPLKPPVDLTDDTPPKPLSFSPGHTTPPPDADSAALGIASSQAIVIKFSEAVTTDGCKGNFSFIPTDLTGDLVSKSWPCSQAYANKDTVVLMPSGMSLLDGTYYVRMDTGSLKDMNGVDMYVLDSRAFTLPTGEAAIHTFTTPTSSISPTVVGSFPCHDCGSDLYFYDEDLADTILLFFSEPVTANVDTEGGPRYITLMDCGSDNVCQDTDSIVNYYGNDILQPSANPATPAELRRYIPAGDITDMRRYRVTVPAGAYTGSSGGNNPEYSFEFVKDSSGFSHREMAVKSTGTSTEDALGYGVSLKQGIWAKGEFPFTGIYMQEGTPYAEDYYYYTEYTVCYCDDQKDMTLEDLFDGDTTYHIYDDLKCQGVPMPEDAETVMVADMPLPMHQCEAKCSKGCTGPFCYCDGYDDTAEPNTLCLPPSLCREACDKSIDCDGINVHDSKSQCVLLSDGIPGAIPSVCVGMAHNVTQDPLMTIAPPLTVAESWQLFKKSRGTACTHATDFTERAGSLAITTRVEVNVDYVLHPGQSGSVELTTPVLDPQASLTFEHSPVFGFTATKLLSEDRITIIDCKGTCGVSSPTTALVEPADAHKIETWSHFSPWSWFVDLPHIDEPNPYDMEKSINYAASSVAKRYNVREGFYCPLANINLDAANVPFDGTLRSIKNHQCFTKCSLNAPCISESGTSEFPASDESDCFCNGMYSGYDGEESNALCADVQLCQYMCDQLEDCVSIDMHVSLPRCFLNVKSECTTHEETLMRDPNYVLLVKGAESNDEQGGTNIDRTFAPPGPPGTNRRLLPASDYGFSWDKMLRFKPIQFKSGGTFKLCFCDSSLLGPGEVCSSEKDYKIEIGTLHASGVSCLIANPKLQRVSCTDQMHGGLRCYEHLEEAPRPDAPVIGMTDLPVEDIVSPLSITTMCAFMPEEEARSDPRCQGVAGYQSTDPLRK